MCESHMKEVIQNLYSGVKVKASYKKGELEVISDFDLDTQRVREAVEKTGYGFIGSYSEPYEKKGFFASLFGK